MRRDKRIPRTLQVAAAFEGEKIGHIAGDIVRFRGDGSPLRALTLSIDPVQDLHGYDAPWPAGGGKNKFNVDAIGNSTYITVSNGVITVSGNSRNPSKKLSDLADLVVGETYVLTASTTGTANYIYLTSSAESWYFGQSRTISQNDLNSNVLFYAGGADVTANISAMMIRLSSVSDASYAPYSNLCPISGWSAANLWRTGKNLLDDSNFTTFNTSFTGWAVNDTGAVSAFNTLKAGTYTMSLKSRIDSVNSSDTSGTYGIFIKSVSSDGEQLSINCRTSINTAPTVGQIITSTVSFRLTDKYVGKFTNVWSYSGRATANNPDTITIYDFQIELSSTPTPYAPYSGNQYTIQLGQTVYGGTLDVLSGVLTVTHQLRTKNTADMNNADVAPGWRNSGIKELIGSDVNTEFSNQIMNIGKYWSVNTNGSNDILFLRTARYNKTQTEWIALAIDVQIAVKLATPITIPLTPQEISTLAGQNVVWADCGEVDVEYVADNGVEGGKLALLLRNRPELLIAMRKGGSPQELLLAMGSRGDARPSITPVRPGLEIKDDEEEELRKW